MGVKVSDNVIYGISPDTVISTLVNTVTKNKGEAEVTDANGNVKATGSYVTGDKITIIGTNETIDIVAGDDAGYMSDLQVVLPFVEESIIGKTFTNEPATIVWPFNDATTPTVYTATPAELFSTINSDLGDLQINGTGTGQPTGIFATTGGGTYITAKTKGADAIIELVYNLKRPYRKNASFIMNDKMIATIRTYKDQNGAYMWQPSLVQGEPDRLLGFPVYTSQYAPEDSIAFGDFSYYNIGDRGVRSFKQLTELFAGNGMIGYVAKERVDGKLVLPEAVQILKVETTDTEE
jgi:hypothetical protein